MQKLVIYLTEDVRVRQCEQDTNPFEITPTWLGTEAAEIYGRTWAKCFKNDIVMLVEEDE